jgi:SAM-dependent methyltransferase
LIDKKTYEQIVGKRIRHDILLKYETTAKLIRKYKRGKLKILDIGCGQGIFSFYSDKSWSIVGIDMDKDRIARANNIERKNTKFCLKSAENFKFNEKFDVVIALDIIEHLNNPQKSLDSAFSALKDDGILIVSNPNRYSVWNVLNNLVHLEDHKHYWRPGKFGEMAKKSGFEMIEVLPRPMLSEGVGWAMKDYRKIQKNDLKLGKALPFFATGWFLVFRKSVKLYKTR